MAFLVSQNSWSKNFLTIYFGRKIWLYVGHKFWIALFVIIVHFQKLHNINYYLLILETKYMLKFITSTLVVLGNILKYKNAFMGKIDYIY